MSSHQAIRRSRSWPPQRRRFRPCREGMDADRSLASPALVCPALRPREGAPRRLLASTPRAARLGAHAKDGQSRKFTPSSPSSSAFFPRSRAPARRLAFLVRAPLRFDAHRWLLVRSQAERLYLRRIGAEVSSQPALHGSRHPWRFLPRAQVPPPSRWPAGSSTRSRGQAPEKHVRKPVDRPDDGRDLGSNAQIALGLTAHHQARSSDIAGQFVFMRAAPLMGRRRRGW